MSAKVFVGNLNYRTTEVQLRRFLSEAGEIRSVAMPLDRTTGKPRGFAFVEFSTADEAERAVTVFDGRTLGGRPLRVKPAEDRRPAFAGRGRRAPGREAVEEDDDLSFGPDEERPDRRRGEREWRQLRRTKRSL